MKVSSVCYLAVLLWLTATTSIAAQRFSFAAIGDNPYTFLSDNDFDKLIDKLNDKDLAFVVHDGDFKASYLDCSDALFARRKAQVSWQPPRLT